MAPRAAGARRPGRQAPSPEWLQNHGRFGSTRENCRLVDTGAKLQAGKGLRPEVARRQQLRKGRYQASRLTTYNEPIQPTSPRNPPVPPDASACSETLVERFTVSM